MDNNIPASQDKEVPDSEETLCGKAHNGGEGVESCPECVAIKGN